MVCYIVAIVTSRHSDELQNTHSMRTVIETSVTITHPVQLTFYTTRVWVLVCTRGRADVSLQQTGAPTLLLRGVAWAR